MKCFSALLYSFLIAFATTNLTFTQVKQNALLHRADVEILSRAIPHYLDIMNNDIYRGERVPRRVPASTSVNNPQEKWVLTEYYDQSWNVDSKSWVNHEWDALTYYANGGVAQELWKSWNGSDWENFWKYTYVYDLSGKEISETLKEYIPYAVGDRWVTSIIDTLGYDSVGQCTGIVWLMWDGLEWMGYEKHSFSYDAYGNRDEEMSQLWNGSSWQNSLMETLSYDSQNREIRWLLKSWNGVRWADASRDTLIYDAGGKLTQDIQQEWNDSSWVNNSWYRYTYDDQGRLIQRILHSWNGSRWLNNNLVDCNYDADGNEIEEIWQTWRDTTWVNFSRYTYTWMSIATSARENPALAKSIALSQNYPNPFNPTTNFEFRIANLGFVSLKAYDELGREVATLVNEVKQPGEYTVGWNAAGIASGVYYCRLTAREVTVIRKIVLLR